MDLVFLNKNYKKYFDYTASGLCLKNIDDAITKIAENYANTHSKVGSLSNYMNLQWKNSYESLFDMLDVDRDNFEIIPTGYGATAAIKKFQELIGIYIPPETLKRLKIDKNNTTNDVPLMIVGPYEHHSNDISYREGIAETTRVELDENGEISINDLIRILSRNQGREIYVCISAASNVTGIITDIPTISQICRRYGAYLCIDAATSSPYMNIPSDLYDVMFMSPHKNIGGPGTVGLLVIRRTLVDVSLPPTFAGGGTVTYVNSTDQYYDDDIHIRETAGTPGILQFIKTAKVYELRNSFGLDTILKDKKRLHRYFVRNLKKIKGVTIYGNMEVDNIGICSFNVSGISPYEICDNLSAKFGLETRAGCSCAGPYGHVLLGLPNDKEMVENMGPVGWLRVSIHYTHTIEDIDYLLQGIEKVIHNLKNNTR